MCIHMFNVEVDVMRMRICLVFLGFFFNEKDDVNNDSSMNKYDETGAASICSGHV